MIGCDPLVAAHKETWQRLRAGRSHVALNANATPTAAFVTNPDWQNPAQACVDTLVGNLGGEAVGVVDAETAASKLMGDSIYTNPMMLGYAWQRGWVPLGFVSLMRAIELNGVQVANNKTAFEWGRRAAHDPKGFAALLTGGGAQVIQFKPRETRGHGDRAPGGVSDRLPERGLRGRLPALCGARAQGRRRLWASRT